MSPLSFIIVLGFFAVVIWAGMTHKPSPPGPPDKSGSYETIIVDDHRFLKNFANSNIVHHPDCPCHHE